jgi:Protein of unknown function (DUF2855)
MTTTSFLVGRHDLGRHTIVDEPGGTPDDLAEGQALLAVSSWALTANNITYGAFGSIMRYWDFFPAPAGWGRIPVWGFADVVASRAEGVEAGARVYGYLPMSTHLVVEPVRPTSGGFADGAAHRQGLPHVYNQYERVGRRDATSEAYKALLQPLFMTSFVLDDWLADNDLFGAEVVVLGSASSKTAIGLAHLLSTYRRARVVGLTSARNAEFVRGTGAYDDVVVYGSLATEAARVPAVFVDMAGSAEVRAEVHTHYGDDLRFSSAVGATHWDEMAGGGDLPGPRPPMFFAPDQITKRRADWGPGGLEARFATAWESFTASVAGWLEVVEVRGPEAVTAAYLEVLEGRCPPAHGLICSL